MRDDVKNLLIQKQLYKKGDASLAYPEYFDYAQYRPVEGFKNNTI